MPYAPREDDGKVRHKYTVDTIYTHLVADYARLSLPEVQQMDILDYLYLRREAVLDLLSRTEHGVEYLNDAWMREQTEPDREMLRRDFSVRRV